MSRPACRSLVLKVALLWVAFSVQQGCGQSEPITSWDSPRLLEVQKEWDSLARFTTQDKSKAEELQGKLERVLKNNLSQDDLRHLAATCGTLPIREMDQSAFARDLLPFMVRAFADAADKDSLVKVLSTRCPSYIYPYEPVEFYLACRGDKLKDPVLILGEAFSQCQVPKVRHRIAAAIRRGFTSLGISGKDDAEFVKNAMQWYEKEKRHLTVNQGYRSLTSLTLPVDEDDPLYKELEIEIQYDKIPPLFVEKASPTEQKGE